MAQSVIKVDRCMMFTNVKISHNGTEHDVLGLIDTGASVCVIDSTFASDYCNIVATKRNLTIGNTSGKSIESFELNLDSISFGGITYPLARCVVVDLAGQSGGTAPKFFVGGEILKKDLWCFDLKDNKMFRCERPIKNIQSTIKWKNHEDYNDVGYNSIYFNGKIAGEKTRIFFDTGSPTNHLPQDTKIKVTKEIEMMKGDIINKVKKTKIGLCKDVLVELPDNKCHLDFIISPIDKDPCINCSFLFGKKFVLDYKKKQLHILNK